MLNFTWSLYSTGDMRHDTKSYAMSKICDPTYSVSLKESMNLQLELQQWSE